KKKKKKNKKKTYSKQQIITHLHQTFPIQLSPTTIPKYPEQINLPSSTFPKPYH
ncbi:RNA polymerase factor sigma-54, partial [Bacillus pumilus]